MSQVKSSKQNSSERFLSRMRAAILYGRSALQRVLVLFMLSLSLFSAAASAAENGQKILVAYFSGTGTTAKVAEMIAPALGADIFRIEAADPFTPEDLSYAPSSRANQEKNQPTLRPEIAATVPLMEQYEVVFLGYPIWSERAPRVVLTFIESHDLKGKRIIPFCTAYTSGIEQSAQELQSLYPELDWEQGHKFGQFTANEDVTSWLTQLGLLNK